MFDAVDRVCSEREKRTFTACVGGDPANSCHNAYVCQLVFIAVCRPDCLEIRNDEKAGKKRVYSMS
jgi:hypothetical protein